MALVSVIVPTYNDEGHIVECLHSITTQTFRNLEIIVVDDSSTDSSPATIMGIAEEDDRVSIIAHQAHRGRFRTILSGLEASTGDYVLFVDSCDCISCDWIRLLLDTAIGSEADIVIGDFALQNTDGQAEIFVKDPLMHRDFVLEGSEPFREYIRQSGLFYGWYVIWNKMYRREALVQSSEYYHGLPGYCSFSTHMGDIVFTSLAFRHSEKAVNRHGAFYFRHIEDAGAIGNGGFFEDISEVSACFDFLDSIVDHSQESEHYLGEWKSLFGREYVSAQNSGHKYTKTERTVLERLGNNCINPIFPEDLFFYEDRLAAFEPFQRLEELKRFISSPDCRFVSFDLFDTLVVRPFYDPTDMFYELDDCFNRLSVSPPYVRFSQIRIDSEMAARKESKAELTIDYLYDYIGRHYPISTDILDALKREEKSLEIRYCTMRIMGWELYSLALLYEKNILVISDMYLDRHTVETILTSNGYTEFTLYLSSESNADKYSGNLFRLALKENYISDLGSIVHIGDNRHSDFEVPIIIGIKSFIVDRPVDLLISNMNTANSGNLFAKCRYGGDPSIDANAGFKGCVGLRNIWAMVANRIYDNPFLPTNPEADFNEDPRYIGYCGLGMQLLGITLWIMSETKGLPCRIHFIKGSGELVKSFYDEYTAGIEKPESDILPVSKTELIAANITCYEDFCIIRNIIDPWKSTPKDVMDIVRRLCDDSIIDSILDYSATLHPYTEQFGSKQAFDDYLMSIIIRFNLSFNFSIFRNNVRDRLDTMIRAEDVIFNDGFYSDLALLISGLIESEIREFRLISDSDTSFYKLSNSKSFFDYKPSISEGIRKDLISGKTCSPRLFEEYPSNAINIILKESAIHFCRDLKSTFQNEGHFFDIRFSDLSTPLERFIISPSPHDVNLFTHKESWIHDIDCAVKMHGLTSVPITDTAVFNDQYVKETIINKLKSMGTKGKILMLLGNRFLR